jgi:hypothetical protein
MTPEQAKFLLSVFLPTIRREFPTTLRVIQAVPADKGDYRPAPNSRSALELAWHLASADIWFLDGFLAGKFDMEDDTMPADFSNSADIAASYEDSMPAKLDKIEKLPAEFWATPLPFFGIYNSCSTTPYTIEASLRRICVRWGRRCPIFMVVVLMSQWRSAKSRRRFGYDAVPRYGYFR